jgi:hypothetical protein
VHGDGDVVMRDANQIDVFSRIKLAQLIMGYCVTQAISCAARLRIADKLVEGPQTIDQLSGATDSSPAHLARLMRALCSVGIFSESEAGYQLTPMSQYLCESKADSLLPLADLHGDELYAAFGKLLDNVQTGTPAWDGTFGRSVWDYFSEHPERGELFDITMRLNHRGDVRRMVSAYDYSAVRTVADVGGGEGSLLREILTSHDHIRGVLVDLPQVVARAAVSDAWKVLATRCRFMPADIRHEMPGGIDLYILRHVLHDWNDDQCVQILSKCRESMCASSRLLVIEALADTKESNQTVAWSDLAMMVFGGEERTASQFEKLFASAGLKTTRVISCERVALIEAGTYGDSTPKPLV